MSCSRVCVTRFVSTHTRQLGQPVCRRCLYPPADLLLAWLHAVVFKKWDGLAIILGHDQLANLKCTGESGEESKGWDCLFGPMPHLCTYESIEVRGTLEVSLTEEYIHVPRKSTIFQAGRAQRHGPMASMGPTCARPRSLVTRLPQGTGL